MRPRHSIARSPRPRFTRCTDFAVIAGRTCTGRMKQACFFLLRSAYSYTTLVTFGATEPRCLASKASGRSVRRTCLPDASPYEPTFTTLLQLPAFAVSGAKHLHCLAVKSNTLRVIAKVSSARISQPVSTRLQRCLQGFMLAGLFSRDGSRTSN